MQRASSFSGAFDAARALQVIISAAYRSGAPVPLEPTVEAIFAKFPHCGMSRNEIWTSVLEAAERAGVRVTGNDDARSLRREPVADGRSGAAPGRPPG